MVNPIQPGVAGLGTSSQIVNTEVPPAAALAAQQIQAVGQSADARLDSNTQDSPQHKPEPGSLEKTLETMNERMQAWSTGMRFHVDEDAQRVVVSIVDNKTGEVLRTVPSEAVLKVAKMIVQMQGQTVNTRA
jgi:flagellar protein FlaG